ncbi:ER membrane protein complex subunit 2-like isoform X1 [Dreissena polymorpha]|uniref:ER membrane protein complex subunit 2-like isoform X1 n=1 Tax=Dreissena polymorpha TaxID=45954 RepID=UPI00226524D5|nr:ER membrane protein complex subunit 2-like isoform X1 [Dreissena polymorpha]
MSWEDARDALRKMREDQVRDGPRVVRLWKQILSNYAHKLGDEVWTVQEQVTIGALDCQNLDLAQECISCLNSKFPGSLRVLRLKGMFYEAEGKYTKANECYDKILEEDKANMFAAKRKIAMSKEQNDLPEAVNQLNKYLETFMTDFDAWMELCDLYLQHQEYSKAAFCLEELIMSNPHSHLYHQKYAEIKYTQGGMENLEIARAYFAQACKLNPNNMRAQFGLLLTSSNLATGYNKSQRSVNAKCAMWAAEQIIDKYQVCGSQCAMWAAEQIIDKYQVCESQCAMWAAEQIIDKYQVCESQCAMWAAEQIIDKYQVCESQCAMWAAEQIIDKYQVCESQCAMWAAEQIIDKYQTTQSQEQLQDTKVLELIRKMQENVSTQHDS